MKRLMTMTLTAMLTLPAFAAIDCKPFKLDVDQAQKVVNDFDISMIRLADKVKVLDDKIAERHSLLQPVLSKISRLNDDIQAKHLRQNQILDLERSIELNARVLIKDEADLITEINRLQILIDNVRVTGQARRFALRDQNRAKKELERVQLSLLPMRTQLNDLAQERVEVARSIVPLQNLIANLDGERNQIENMTPSLNNLTIKRNEAQTDLDNEDRVRLGKVAQLNDALERQLMCKTYTVKYPTALRIAKEISRVGCSRYTPIENNGEFAIEAETETLQAMCGR